MAARLTPIIAAEDRRPAGTGEAATDAGAAARGGGAAAVLEAGVAPDPEADLATAAPSLVPVLDPDLDLPPSPGRPVDPNPSPRRSPDRGPGPGPGPDPEVLHRYRRGNRNLDLDPRAPPSLLKRKELFHLRIMVMSMRIQVLSPKPGDTDLHNST